MSKSLGLCKFRQTCFYGIQIHVFKPFIISSTSNDPMIRVMVMLKRGYIEFKYYADAIHSGVTPPG